VAASYVEALIPCEEFGFRWNASGYPAGTNGIGDGVTLSFSFMTGPTLPAHYTAGAGDASGFAAFTAAQEAAVRAALGLIADVADITFTDLENANTGQILFGRNDNTFGAAGYAYYPSEHSQRGGDVWIDKDLYTSSDLDPGERGFSTLIHEIGHALGL
jgi:serralysin